MKSLEYFILSYVGEFLSYASRLKTNETLENATWQQERRGSDNQNTQKVFKHLPRFILIMCSV